MTVRDRTAWPDVRGRLVNASVRGHVGRGDDALIAGFVLTGPGTKPVLIRAVGPTLARFGVPQPLHDPRLDLHDLQIRQIAAQAAAWNASAQHIEIASNARRLGAFPLDDDSADSAMVARLGRGVYTANASGAVDEEGTALVEIYDADPSLPARLVNLSARNAVTASDEVLTLGFVISGNSPCPVLLRGVGPGLARLGVGSPLADPRLELRDYNGVLIAGNDDWKEARDVAAVAALVGAFPLPDGSKDAALVAMLPPGVYTVQIKGDTNAGGVALAELYEVPAAACRTRWTMLNVSPRDQQADCHLIELPDGRIVLIDVADAGDAPGTAVAALQARGIRHVDLVVLTHFHRDHYGRLRDLIDAGVKVDRVAYNLPAPEATATDAEAPWGFSRADATALLDYLRGHGVECFTPRTGQRLIDLDLPDGNKVTLDVVCLYDGAHTPIGLTDTNDTSIITRLTHAGTRILFTGDLNQRLGQWLADGGFDLRADLIKLPHHGTEGCAPNAFFDRVGARAAFVPAPRSLWESDRSARIRDYYAQRGIPAYVSGIHGDVTVSIGSEGYTVQTQWTP